MGALPRLAGDEILGDHARLGCLTGTQVGIGELRLRVVHRRLEPAVNTDSRSA